MVSAVACSSRFFLLRHQLHRSGLYQRSRICSPDTSRFRRCSPCLCVGMCGTEEPPFDSLSLLLVYSLGEHAALHQFGFSASVCLPSILLWKQYTGRLMYLLIQSSFCESPFVQCKFIHSLVCYEHIFSVPKNLLDNYCLHVCVRDQERCYAVDQS